MKNILSKQRSRIRRKKTIRKRITGSQLKPRVTVSRSNKFFYAQAIDDDSMMTLLGGKSQANMQAASAFGKEFATKLKKLGLTEVVFDRNGYNYHGRVKAFVDGLRETGIRV